MKKKNDSKKEEEPEKNSEEESELEKEIESEEEAEEISNFIEETRLTSRSGKIKAPVLEKINSLSSPINLEENLNSSNNFTEKNETIKEEFNYVSKENKGEPKYQQNYEHQSFNGIRNPDITELGREKADLFPRREVGFKPSSESAISEPRTFETYEPLSRIDIENLGREKFSERKEIKYKPSRL